MRAVSNLKFIVAIAAIILSCTRTSAADPGNRERAFVRALELFDDAKSPDDYRASARELETIVADGFQSGAVYYNLGNAWFRAGEYGRAILNYRKATPFRPRDSYLKANLQQAIASAPGRLPEPPQPPWSHVFFWSDWLSFPSRVRLGAIALSLAAALLCIALLIRRRLVVVIATAALSVGVAVSLEAFLNNPAHLNRAVITAETIARKGTGKDYEPAFDQPLRDGTEFTVLTQTTDWTLGHFETIGEGWVRNEHLAR